MFNVYHVSSPTPRRRSSALASGAVLEIGAGSMAESKQVAQHPTSDGPSVPGVTCSSIALAGSSSSDLDTSETETLFAQLFDRLDQSKLQQSMSDKTKTGQARNSKTRQRSCSPKASSSTEEEVLPRFLSSRRSRARGLRSFHLSKDYQSGSRINHPSDLEFSPHLQFHSHSSRDLHQAQGSREADFLCCRSSGFSPFSRQQSPPSSVTVSERFSESPRRKRNRWSCDEESTSFFGVDDERRQMEDEDYARFLQQQIDLEDYWHDRCQERDYSPGAVVHIGRRHRSVDTVPPGQTRWYNLSSPRSGNSYENYWELQEHNGDVKDTGMSQEAIDRLPTSHLTKTDLRLRPESECSICMEKYEAGDTERVLTCFHSFHASCVDKWLLKNGTCPVCRESTFPEDNSALLP